MNIVLLSGNSLRNKPWIHDVGTIVAPLFDNTYVHDYRHWERGEPEVDRDYELDQLRLVAENMRPYCLFAKSIGSVIALRGMAEGVLRPERCVFVGLPLHVIESQALPVRSWLARTNAPITILQNEHDPLGSYESVRRYVPSEHGVIRLAGDTHDYTNFGALTSALTNSS